MKDLGVVDLDAALPRAGLHHSEIDADFLLQATELAERATTQGGVVARGVNHSSDECGGTDHAAQVDADQIPWRGVVAVGDGELGGELSDESRLARAARPEQRHVRSGLQRSRCAGRERSSRNGVCRVDGV